MPAQSSKLSGSKIYRSSIQQLIYLWCSKNLLFSQTKDDENIRNKYNHNFTGRYCTCDRPYPDEDDQVLFYVDEIYYTSVYNYTYAVIYLKGQR